MRFKIQTEGGFASFPGLRAPVEIDTAELREEEAAELEFKVEEARFFERPEPEGPPPGAADLRLRTVTVEAGERSRTMRAYEPIEDAALRALVEALDARAREIRRARRRGGGEGERP